MTSDSEMTTRQMGQIFDVTHRTLPFCETSGLPAPRRGGQARLYGKTDRARLKLILPGKRFGFTLEQIREILERHDPNHHNLRQTEKALAATRVRLVEMRHQHHDLGKAIAELEDPIAQGETALHASAGTPAGPILSEDQ